MSQVEDKKAIAFWDKYVQDLIRSTVVDHSETQEDKLKRIEQLEKDNEAWFKYYFPNYYTSEPAPFHKRSTRRIMNNPEWYEVRAWSRELAKSSRTMMEVMKLTLTKQKRFVLLISANLDSATKLLKPYKLNLENNQRIINDYGKQMTFGDWTDTAFNTKLGVSFVALGARQSPRGLRNEEIRPDIILMDDFDTDVDCRNPDIVDQKWDWFEQAVLATRSISKSLLVLWCGNIIAENCCIKRAIKKADKADVINIRDKEGNSSWPQKNTEALIDIALRTMSWASIQKEYYNTPIVLGKVFKSLTYGKMRPLRDYKFLVAYTDPSYKKKGDYKATALIGRWKNEYHVLRMHCAQTTTAKMLDWNYEIQKDFGSKVPIYYYIEWPWIDDPIKLEIKEANKRHGVAIHPKADERKKPDKYHRIESNLEPINRAGKLVFNEQLRDTEEMQAAEGQFLALSPKSRANDDAPDAVEGAKWVVDSKTSANMNLISTQKYQRRNSAKHF